jgi:hypothetical protein
MLCTREPSPGLARLMSVSKTRKNFSASMRVSSERLPQRRPGEYHRRAALFGCRARYVQPLCENSVKASFRKTTEISSRETILRIVELGLKMKKRDPAPRIRS